MRVSFGQSFDEGLRSIARAAEELAAAQRRVSTGRRIQAPSDDPAGTVQAIRERGSLSTIGSYERAANSAESALAVADVALSDVITQLTAAKTTAAASRSSSRTPAELEAYANEIIGIRDAIFNDINTKFGDTYLFSGASRNAAYGIGNNGYEYQGGGAGLEVDITNNRTAQVTFDGRAILQGATATDPDILTKLTQLADEIRAGDTDQILAGLDAIDAAFDRAVFAQTQVGITQRTIADVGEQLTVQRLGTVSRISEIEDANMAEAISDLNRAELAQQSALGSFATLARLTLLDYLK
jgi:flagellar hook-associated protein 3 FlgL